MPSSDKPIPHTRSYGVTLLCKLVGSRIWRTVSNPLWSDPHAENYARQMLQNWAVEYVEYVSNGIVYRVVRTASVGAYRLE